MLLWKTQVMNFITWALNSDSTAALFKSSRQGTVWTLPRPARSTEVTETQTQTRRACGEEHGERRIPACGYATSAARPGLSTSAAIHLPRTASLSPHGRAGWDLCSHTQTPPGSRGRAWCCADVRDQPLLGWMAFFKGSGACCS